MLICFNPKLRARPNGTFIFKPAPRANDVHSPTAKIDDISCFENLYCIVDFDKG